MEGDQLVACGIATGLERLRYDGPQLELDQLVSALLPNYGHSFLLVATSTPVLCLVPNLPGKLGTRTALRQHLLTQVR